MRPGCWDDAAREASVSQQDKPFSHRGRLVTTKEWGCGERNERKKEGGGALKPNVFSSVEPGNSFEHFVPSSD